jgi:hypothetical protein
VYAKITAGQTGFLPRAFPVRCKVVIVALPGSLGSVITSVCRAAP